MRRITTSVTGVGISPVLPLDQRAQYFNVGIAIEVSGTVTYTVQFTLDDIYNSAITPTWYSVSAGMTSATASQAGQLTIPASAMRLNVTAGTGTATMVLLQSSGQG
jgi:hypothetical protein